jgi:hypothetical protein
MCMQRTSDHKHHVSDIANLSEMKGGVSKSRESKFCTLAPGICGLSVWNLLHVTVPATRIQGGS